MIVACAYGVVTPWADVLTLRTCRPRADRGPAQAVAAQSSWTQLRQQARLSSILKSFSVIRRVHMNIWSGECLCGTVRYRIEAQAPAAMYLCHCSRCRKETGTIHGANVFFGSGALAFERGADALTRFSLAGTRKKRAFCSTCGSPMPWQTDGGHIVLPAGSLDDDSGLRPTAHIFCDSEAAWTSSAAAAPRLSEGPA